MATIGTEGRQYILLYIQTIHPAPFIHAAKDRVVFWRKIYKE